MTLTDSTASHRCDVCNAVSLDLVCEPWTPAGAAGPTGQLCPSCLDLVDELRRDVTRAAAAVEYVRQADLAACA